MVSFSYKFEPNLFNFVKYFKLIKIISINQVLKRDRWILERKEIKIEQEENKKINYLNYSKTIFNFKEIKGEIFKYNYFLSPQ